MLYLLSKVENKNREHDLRTGYNAKFINEPDGLPM